MGAVESSVDDSGVEVVVGWKATSEISADQCRAKLAGGFRGCKNRPVGFRTRRDALVCLTPVREPEGKSEVSGTSFRRQWCESLGYYGRPISIYMHFMPGTTRLFIIVKENTLKEYVMDDKFARQRLLNYTMKTDDFLMTSKNYLIYPSMFLLLVLAHQHYLSSTEPYHSRYSTADRTTCGYITPSDVLKVHYSPFFLIISDHQSKILLFALNY